MICYATNAMIPALKTIWKDCFGDDVNYIDFYFEKQFHIKRILVWQEEGIPYSMVSLIPATVKTKHGQAPACYLYALATNPDYQGKGMASALLGYLDTMFKQKKVIPFLVPASKGLQVYYQGHGYNIKYMIKEIQFPVSETISANQFIIQNKLTLHYLTPSEYKIARDKKFNSEEDISWGLEALEYIISEHQYCGGFVSRLEWCDKKAELAGGIVGETLYVKETTLLDEDVIPVLSGAAVKMNCSMVRVRLQADSRLSGVTRTLGLAKSDLLTGKGYLNLVLD